LLNALDFIEVTPSGIENEDNPIQELNEDWPIKTKLLGSTIEFKLFFPNQESEV